jgi:hypothetical protein
MLTITASRRLKELGVVYYTLGFACANVRETREALLKATRQGEAEIDVYLPSESLMHFVMISYKF